MHFLLIGLVLFIVYDRVNVDRDQGMGVETGRSERRIVVSAGRIEQLANIFAKTWQRPQLATN